MKLEFNEPWIKDVLALGFEKPIEMHRGLPRTDLGFYEVVRLTKGNLGFDEPLENQQETRPSWILARLTKGEH